MGQSPSFPTLPLPLLPKDPNPPPGPLCDVPGGGGPDWCGGGVLGRRWVDGEGGIGLDISNLWVIGGHFALLEVI